MTFLELVKALQEESGTGSTAITTIVGATGEALRLRNWIQSANLAIQSKYVDWKFLYEAATTITTGVGTADYASPSDCNVWNHRSFERDGVDMTDLMEYRQEAFPSASSGPPEEPYLLPNGQLRFWPTPDAAYSVTADYWKMPEELDVTNNSDTGVIPEQFHRLIVYTALGFYANYEDADEVAVQAQDGIGFWLPRLEAHQLTNHQAGTLADNNEIVIVAE